MYLPGGMGQPHTPARTCRTPRTQGHAQRNALQPPGPCSVRSVEGGATPTSTPTRGHAQSNQTNSRPSQLGVHGLGPPHANMARRPYQPPRRQEVVLSSEHTCMEAPHLPRDGRAGKNQGSSAKQLEPKWHWSVGYCCNFLCAKHGYKQNTSKTACGWPHKKNF